MPTTLVRALLVALALVTPASASIDPTAPLVCRQAKELRAGERTARPAIAVGAAGAGQALSLGRARTVCLPAVENGSAPILTDALAAWEIRRRRGDTPPGDRSGESIAIETRFGAVDGRLGSLLRALVPASARIGDGGAPPPATAGTDLLCHGLRTTGDPTGRLTLTTAFGTHALKVERPRRFCVATTLPAYVCHRARVQRGTTTPRGDPVSLATSAGTTVARLGPVTEVCVPVLGGSGPPPFTLRIEPASRTIEWRDTVDLRAFADYADGRIEEITARVAWTASDGDVAALADPPAPGRFFGRNPGTVTLAATDPTTGTRGEMQLTVAWTLQRIEVSPRQINRFAGSYQSFTATGTFASGVTHNLTPRVTWATGDPSIAAMATAGGSFPSRVEAIAFGSTTVSACDPISGICSGDHDGDGTIVVQGELQFIELRPSVERSVFPGGSIRYTAIGHYADGRERNLTQAVEWSSTAPGVAVAPNDDGDRSRFDGVAPGFTFVRARDPRTGFQSLPHTLYVLGDLLRIYVHPFDALGDAVRHPGSRRFTALGDYVGGGYRNLTQEVTWHSRDPAIAIAPNTPNDRSRIDSAGAPGQARIWAEHTSSGIASGDVIFRVLGDLVALDVLFHRRGQPPRNRVPIGGLLDLRVAGTFAGGERLNFSRFVPGGYTVVSSDPSIAEIVDRHFVRGITPGVVQLRAVDEASGFTGTPVELVVQGALERLVPRPIETVLIEGATAGIRVDGHFAPGLVLPFGGPLEATSSDESVATVRRQGRLYLATGVGPGTVTISFRDPVSGVGTTDSGDDVTLTFYPDEDPSFVSVTPPVSTLPVDGFDHFTAVATFPNGQTLNVTQRATWTSSNPSVAEVVGVAPTGLSRTVGRGAGVATIAATYRGVTSTSSGQDGVTVVSPALALTVLGADTPLGVDETRALRATALLASGRILNVTHMLEWSSLDVGVADFLDDEQPNLVTGLTEGDADVDVGLPNGGVRTTVRLTVSDDPITTSTSTPTTTTTTTTLLVAPLRIEPASLNVDFGQAARFRAMRGTVDVSDAVTWAVDDTAMVLGDGGAFTATEAGTTTVRVLDPEHGDVAAAALDVEWSLRSVALWPRQVNRTVGDWERFTALGTFRRGGTAVVTDRLDYAVADPTVALLESSLAHPSEVVALREGRTAVSACDPLTGVCSSTTGGDAMLLVGGGLQSITVTPGATVTHFPGEYEQYTATGHFADGTSQDMTALVAWSVTDPAVALASNTDGTRGRVYALTPGNTAVRATDPATGISSGGNAFSTLGALRSIDVHVVSAYVEAGTPIRIDAYGIYDGGYRNFSQVVTWASDDPAVVAAPNQPGDRNRLDALVPGVARVHARLGDVTSRAIPVSVFGALESLELRLSAKPRLGIGGQLDVLVDGHFESPGFDHPYRERFSWTGRPYQLVSDAPGVLAVVDHRTVRGVSGGIANLTAVDTATGVVSAPIAITVQGVLERISVSPAGIVRALGETQAFTATGHYVPSLTGLLTQQVEWRSSDEGVAVPLNEPGNRSRILMVGAGTAVISAFDPVTGIASTDSGGDVTVTVRPGQLDRIVVSPPFTRRMQWDEEEFTAIGFYPDGSSINVTQQVEWLSSDSSVAGAFGPPNRASLIRAVAPGTAAITAVHPQGVRSSDSGHDAIMEVDRVVSLQITPSQRTLLPGQSTQFTVRATLASGASLNVTQQAEYFTTSPSVLSVPNVPPRRSEVIAIAPGEAVLQAYYGFAAATATIRVMGTGSPSGAFVDGGQRGRWRQ